MAEGEGRVIATFDSYAGMVEAIRNRINELALNGERFDEFAGLPRGYLSKLVGARPVRRVGMTSMGPLFGALGIYCIVVENPAATARLKNGLVPNQSNYMRPTYTHLIITNRKWARIQKIGRQARWERLSKQERSKAMEALALKRWKKAGKNSKPPVRKAANGHSHKGPRRRRTQSEILASLTRPNFHRRAKLGSSVRQGI
jgi:hypothetical protein